MSNQELEKLTPEQESLIPVYREKWINIALSTERIDIEKAAQAIKDAYILLGKQEPQIIFLDSPKFLLNKIEILEKLSLNDLSASKILFKKRYYKLILFSIFTALAFIFNWHTYSSLTISISKLAIIVTLTNLSAVFMTILISSIIDDIKQKARRTILFNQTGEGIKYKMEQSITSIIIANKLNNNILDNVIDKFGDVLEGFWKNQSYYSYFNYHEMDRLLNEYYLHDNSDSKADEPPMIATELCARENSYIDFYFSEVGCDYKADNWAVAQSLAIHCGWIFPYEKVCFVCDRPIKISYDNEQRIHAEGEAAAQFADGYSIYGYHGVKLTEKYGKLHPQQWQPKWLLEENNAELRRVLIQGIGYSRIIEELQAVELDTWQEYTLFKIHSDIDVEPIYLLKMTCPSTQRIHVLRVPPDIQSAKEAIFWINWGIAPEEFSVQT
jgi:hypothetical protein